MIPAFSSGNLGNGMPQPFLVIEINRRDDTNRRLHRICGIESSAHAGFENDNLAAAVVENVSAQRQLRFQKMSDADPNRG